MAGRKWPFDGFVHYGHPETQHLYDTANEDWFLLLQLDTDDGPDGLGWMWGDVGVMFFYVRRRKPLQSAPSTTSG
jgi:uncharacterized protein YwqG